MGERGGAIVAAEEGRIIDQRKFRCELFLFSNALNSIRLKTRKVISI